MIKAILLAAAALTGLGASGGSPAQFDLICKGEQTTRTFSDRDGKTAPYAREFRIDLTRNIFCAEDCKGTSSMASVTDAEIILVDDKAHTSNISIKISRGFGGFLSEISDPTDGFSETAHGTCEHAPFKGLPANKF